MSWIAHSQPAEPDLPPPDPPPAPSRRDALAAERATLLTLLRPRVRSERQERIRRRITAITRDLLLLETDR